MKQISWGGGLTLQEAERRLEKNGKNVIIESKKESKLLKFFKEFCNIMIIVLLFAAAVSAVVSIINNESFIDSIIILAIVVINAVLGFVQELKADKAIDALKKMQITSVKVKRDNTIVVVDSQNVVVGDILVLEAGDKVPADARIIWEASFKVDESSLTGESVAVSKTIKEIEKTSIIADQVNMVFAGTSVVYGKCLAVVVKTGMNTEFGLIAKVVDGEEKETTPLQKRINAISKVISIIISCVVGCMFVVGLIKNLEITNILMLSISLAVAAIPEGLPAIITIVLSLGMTSMAKKKALVRKMSSVETLGCTEIICSDKTGTITQNKMTVEEMYYNKRVIKGPFKQENLLIDIMILCNDAEKNNNKYIGDPTEIALYDNAQKSCIVENIRNLHPRIDELPFDSERKMMSTINLFKKENKLLCKGSFDSVITKCTKIFENGKIIALTKQKKEELKLIENKQSAKAYRVLAYAYKDIPKKYLLNNKLENDLVFVGLTCMIDPPRKDVRKAIQICKKANIRTIMITGDSVSTALAIAKSIGICGKKDLVISGRELDQMNYEQLKDIVNKCNVFARVSPSNKLAIVNMLKSQNKVVAMTGDGVNDAPALKAADIGVGMGISGTEVSKNVSDIVLSDDSFSTIVAAVKEGRRIFDNIRNVIVYLLAGNIAEVLVVFIGMLCGFEIFLPIQLLYMNLITDSFPAIALAFEKEEKNVMTQKIRGKDTSFFTSFILSKMLFSAILKTIVILAAYFVGKRFYNVEIAATMSFLMLILVEMLFAYTCKNLKHNVINKNIFNNKHLNISMTILGLVQIIVFVSPIRTLFGVVELSFSQCLICFGIVGIMFVIDELSKKWFYKKFKD